MKKQPNELLKRLRHHVRSQNIKAYYQLFTKFISLPLDDMEGDTARWYKTNLRKEAKDHTILPHPIQSTIRQQLDAGLQWLLDDAHKGVMDSINIPDDYTCVFISIFDSWKSRAEKNPSRAETTYPTWCQQLAHFHRALFQATALYGIHPIPMYLPSSAAIDNFFFTEYKNLSTFTKYNANPKRYFFDMLLSPEHDFIYRSNFDFAHMMLIKGESCVPFLEKLTRQHNLHLLT